MRQRCLNDDVVINCGQGYTDHSFSIFQLPPVPQAQSVCWQTEGRGKACQQRARSCIYPQPIPWTTGICFSPSTWRVWTQVGNEGEKRSFCPFSPWSIPASHTRHHVTESPSPTIVIHRVGSEPRTQISLALPLTSFGHVLPSPLPSPTGTQPHLHQQHWFFNPLWLMASLIAQLVKKSTCNAGDPSSIPGSKRYTGKKIDYPLQYSWAFLVARLVKNLPAMQETWVWSFYWDDLLEKGMATYSSILAWRIPWTSPWSHK